MYVVEIVVKGSEKNNFHIFDLFIHMEISYNFGDHIFFSIDIKFHRDDDWHG